jgi:hypothetical protein
MKIFVAVLLTISVSITHATNTREHVKLPSRMQTHMLGNMRDHLAALAEAQRLIAAGKWNRAARVIESRIGMSSLKAHGASHMAKFMPKPMRELGTAMHHEASRLARKIEEENPRQAFKGFSILMQRCNACHVRYRIR